MKKLIIAVLGLLLLATLASAQSTPPAPFPVVVEVIMGGSPVDGQVVFVDIRDSETDEVITKGVFVTDSSGRTVFDLGSLKDCSSEFVSPDGSCYVGRSRAYDGDDVRFVVTYKGLEFEETRSVESLRLQIGVDTKLLRVSFIDAAAPAQVIIEEVEVVKEVIVTETKTVTETVTETIVICEDGSEVENADECPEAGGVSNAVFATTIAVLTAILAYIGVSWGKGYLGLAKYYWNRNEPGDRVRALRMLLTVIKRAKEDYYKKK